MFAIMPPSELMVTIDNVRKAFSEKYGSKKALKPPVHITIYEPFHAAEDIERRFLTLDDIIKRQTPFSIELQDYSFFENPLMKSPVAYIAVKNNSALTNLQKVVVKEVSRVRKQSSKSHGFTPHFTMGYRNISWDIFPEIKSDYLEQTFEASFSCNAIYLWKHDGGNWQILREFKFENDHNEAGNFGQLGLFS